MDDFTCYALSNGTPKIFPNNTLSKFSVKFPQTLRLSDDEAKHYKWFIALNSIALPVNFEVGLKNSPIIFQTMSTFDESISQSCREEENTFNCEFTPTLQNSRESDDSDEHTFRKCYSDSTTLNNCYVTRYDHKIRELLNSEYNKIKLKYKFTKMITNYYFKSFSTQDHFQNLTKFLIESYFDFTLTEQNHFYITSKYHRLLFLRSDLYDCFTITQYGIEITDETSRLSNIFLDFQHARNLNRGTIKINDVMFVIFVFNEEFTKLDFNLKHFINSSTTDTEKPKLLKIQCDEMNTQILNNTYSKDLEIIMPDYEINEGHYFYEFQTPSFIPLLTSEIDFLTFQVVNEKNEIVNFKSGPATVLNMSLKKMECRENHFYIKLTSSDKDSKFSELNSILPYSLNLSKNWYVALKQISFPAIFNTFPKERTNHLMVKTLESGSKTTKRVEHTINNGIYSTEDLVNILQTKIITHEHLSMSYNDNRVAFHSTQFCSIYFTSELAKILGFQLPESSTDTHKISLEPNQTILCEREVDINFFKPSYLMIYTDLVKETIISGSYTNLLKIVPINFDSDVSKLQTAEFIHLEFRELANHLINEIKIEIRDHSGNLIQFAHNNIYLNLVFSCKTNE